MNRMESSPPRADERQVSAGNGRQRRLGRMLMDRGLLSADQLDSALQRQTRLGQRLGELLCEMHFVKPGELTEVLAAQAGYPRISLIDRPIDPKAVESLSAECALRYRVLPFEIRRGALHVAMADPLNPEAAEAVRVATGRRLKRHYCPDQELGEAMEKAYGSHLSRMIADMDSGDAAESEGEVTELELKELAAEPTVVNLVNLMLLEAIQARASDVHVEPFEKQLKIKYRIDGILQEMSPPPRDLYAAIVSRVKIMAGMNIAERFVPQDGHIAFPSRHGKVDIRVGTVPTVFGESVAMRILDRSIGLIELDQLGFDERDHRNFVELLGRPHGIVLVTGPTGSGKTTTLYAALNHIYTPQKKIITVEDPVEYQLEGINQIPVNRKRGIDFASGLRAILRQDPDVIMIGEVRDRETADIAIRSALTGHLVFSTLHTNDAAGAVSRLLDMGVEPYLLSSSMEGVLAQRLVRRVCTACKISERPDDELLRRIGFPRNRAQEFFRGKGCSKCRQTGYAGRMGIFELLRMTEPVRRAILQRASAAEIAAVAADDHEPMRFDGYRRAAMGWTTLEEVLRVTQDSPAEPAVGID